MPNFVPYHMQFKSHVNEEERVKTSVGSDSLVRQEKGKPDIEIKQMLNTEYAIRMNKSRNANGIAFEQNKVKQMTNYRDFGSERAGIHTISSRGLMVMETHLEIDERASFGAMLHEQNKLYGRTQV